MNIRNRLLILSLAWYVSILYSGNALGGDGTIRRTTHPVPNRYVVIFTKTLVLADRTAADLTRSYGGTVIHLYRGEPFEGVNVTGMPEAAAAQMSADPRVDSVYEDPVPTLSQVPPGWALDRNDQRNLPLDGNYIRDCDSGSSVRVYVFDCGINHVSEFGTRLIDGWVKPYANDGFADTYHHGTSVASIIGGNTWGVATSVTLVNVKVLGGGVADSLGDSIAAIRDFVNPDADSFGGPRVVNMSLIGTDFAPFDTEVLNSVNNHSITYVVGAGNDYTQSQGIPSCSAGTPALLGPNNGVITVAATMLSLNGLQDLRSNHPNGDGIYQPWASDYGSCVDIFAPGSDVDAIDFSGTHTLFSGTSASAPFVTGVVSRRMQLYWNGNPVLQSPAAIESDLKNIATVNVIDAATIGAGSPNLLLFDFHAHCRP